MISTAAKAWWAFLAIIMGLAVWLCGTGNVWLHGFPVRVLEGLASGKALLLPSAVSWPLDGVALLGSLPGDAVAWASAATALLNGLSFLSLYLAGAWTWRNPIGPALLVASAFFGSSTLWIRTASPYDSLSHLMLALSLAALLRGAVPVLAGLVLGVAVLAPQQGVMLYLALAYLAYRRQAAYGLAVPTLALFGVGTLLIPICGDYRLAPSLSGWQISTLLPLVLCLWPGSIRSARGGIYASLLLGSALTGAPELASALAVGDLAFVALERESEPPKVEEQETRRADPRQGEGDLVGSGWSWPVAALISLTATAGLLGLALPGERYLNRQVLIPAQRAKVPFVQLFGVFNLHAHARHHHGDPWRARAAFGELSPADYELALDLSDEPLPHGFCPLTLDSMAENRKVALVYALVSGRPLRGWDDLDHLAAPLLLCKSRSKNFIKEGPTVVFRKKGTARVAERPETPEVLAPLDFRSVLLLAYRPQPVSHKSGAAYLWSGGSERYELSFIDQPAEVMLSARPGEYRISSLAEGGAVRRFEVPPVKWELSELSLEPLPSRSIVPLRLRLTNGGSGPLGSDLISSWLVETTTGGSFSSFLQSASKQFILYPGESTEILLQMATPEAEGVYRLKTIAITPEGVALEVPLAKDLGEIRTWRRLPPVGTWVEEP